MGNLELFEKKYAIEMESMYKFNIALIIPFIVLYAILSVVLPIHTDNTLFYLSGGLFMLSTIMIPVNKLIGLISIRQAFSRGTRTFFHPLPYVPQIYNIIHVAALLLGIILFSIWLLTLSSW
jgi:hypothetical protein